MLKQVVDGFSYNTMLLWQPVRFFPNALAQLDVLRRAANYRARWWVIPDDIDQPIRLPGRERDYNGRDIPSLRDERSADVRCELRRDLEDTMLSFIQQLGEFIKHFPSIQAEKYKDCVCGGKCSCHVLLQYGGDSCPFPPDPSCVQGFDICHRCVCLDPKRKERACSSKS